MKWFICQWEQTSVNGLAGVARDLAQRSHWLSATSEGTYVHILCTARGPIKEYVWEVIYQDANGRWQEREDDEDSLEKAKGKVIRTLLESGYRAINKKCQVLE